ncbi:MAG: lysylphosphatidylglycerol synthase transmembrane domain-containing protein [Gemmatimonadales bacterium]
MTPPEPRRGRGLHIVLGIAISAVLVVLAFHNKNPGDLWAQMRSANPLLVLLGIAIATVPFPLRVPRWELLLRADDGTPLLQRSLWHAIAIGFAANNLLPLRAGEVLRVGAVHRLTGVRFAAALSSVAVERVVDALTVVALLAVGLVAAHLPPGVRIGGGPPIGALAVRIGVVCLAALAAAVVAAWRRQNTLALLERFLPKGTVGQRIVTFADHVLRGLGALRDPRRAAPIVVWSVVIWVVNAASYFIVFKAFHFAVPFSGALIMQGALMFGIAVPSTPGYVGIFETIIPLALSLYGIDSTAALACAVVYHVTTFVPITFLGVLAAIRSGVRLRAQPATP